MEKKRVIGILVGVSLMLLVPLVAMRFTDEVNWTLFDFAVAGVLLFGTGIICEFVLRKINKTGYRIGIVVGLLAALVLIWTELAVGIFGTPFAGN